MPRSFAFIVIIQACLGFSIIPYWAHAEDNCRLYQRVMNNLGVSMSRYRLIIASSDDPEAQDLASAELRRHTAEYRRIKRQFNQARCDGWSRD